MALDEAKEEIDVEDHATWDPYGFWRRNPEARRLEGGATRLVLEEATQI